MWRWLVPVLLVAFAFAAHGLDKDAIWADELYSIRDAGGPYFGPLTPAQIWERVASGNPWHAPGYFILLNAWSQVGGWSPAALRLFAALAGLLALAWTFRVGRDFASAWVGVYAAVLLGTSVFYLNYLHEIRMYTLVGALAVVIVWLYGTLVYRRGRGWLIAALGVCAAALLYTHYLSSLLLGVVALYHAAHYPPLRPPSRFMLGTHHAALGTHNRWWLIVAALGLAALAFVPWLGVLVRGLDRNSGDEDLQNAALDPFGALVQLLTLFSNGLVPLVVILLVAAGWAAWRRSAAASRRSVAGAGFLVVFAGASMAAVLAANVVLRILAPNRGRYLLVLFPLLALAAGVGLRWLEQRVARSAARSASVVVALVLLVWAGAGWLRRDTIGFNGDLQSTWFVFPMHQLDRALRPLVQTGDVVLGYIPDGLDTWTYYNTFDIANVYLQGFAANYRVSMTLPDGHFEQIANVETNVALASAARRVWTAHMPPAVPADLARLSAWMRADAGLALCPVGVERRDLHIALYTRTPTCCLPAPDAVPRIAYPDGVALMGADVPAAADDALTVTVGWRVDDTLDFARYSAALHLLDPDGALVAGHDYGLPLAAFRCETTTLDVSTLAPGTHTLALVVYDWQTGERLIGTDAQGATGERLALAQVRVGG